MSIKPLSSAGPASVAGGGTTPKLGGDFGRAMRAGSTAAARPELVGATPRGSPLRAKSIGPVATGRARAESTRGVRGVEGAQRAGLEMLDRVSQAQSQMEQALELAESGMSFSPAELLSLQAQVYRASQELDLAGRIVEKATGGVKQILQTQV